MTDKMTICQCCEYLATMIDDKELLETIDYIEERAKAMHQKLVERKNEVERLEKALDKACEELAKHTGSCPLDTYDIDLDCEKKCDSQTKECWKEWCLEDVD